MDNNLIRQLLAKYFSGDTTLEEERILQEFFAAETNPEPEWLPLKKQFALFHYGKSLSFDTPLLESKIMEGIEQYERRPAAQVRHKLPFRMLIAASFAILVGLSGVLIYYSQIHRLKDTYADPQLAYNETQKALLYISQTMNKGMKPLANVSKMSAATEPLRNLEKMDESLGMLNLVSFINQSSNLKK